MLVDSLLRKAMYNLKENEWTPDQRESFRCYRTDIADTIMYCFNILRVNINPLINYFNCAILMFPHTHNSSSSYILYLINFRKTY